ncbi:MAG TPA: T9SS type A sorting domain-containing protein [Bacteroidales bacterium]|nr:T9SS type A sorting domain-containing protein [Bacteroidales bacterium]HRZ49645.1 T9SS type A sorting domain-containing protein [Bacteroidales bacterium]
MRKLSILFTAIFSVLSLGAGAQSLSVTFHGNAVLNGTTLDVSGKIDTVIIVDAKVINNSSAAVEVKVRKDEIYTVLNSTNTFCFAGNCYGGSTMVSVGSVNLAAGGGWDTSFTGDYYPLNNTGTTIIRYTFFNVANTNDTISFTVRFTGTIGVNDFPSVVPEITAAYPNPATDKVTFAYTHQDDKNPLVLTLRDFAGRTVREAPLPPGEGLIDFDLSTVESGIYFYSLIRNQQTILTRKLVVKK